MMSKEMTGVYSGGLMYEYSYEANEYGIVKLSDVKAKTVSKMDEFAAFKSILSASPAPTGSGGAATTTHAVNCPTSEAVWQVNPSLVPEMPSQAQKYMKDGAGKGPGFDVSGDGSQNAADSGTATASVTGGQASPTGKGSGSKGSDNAAPAALGPLDRSPFIITAVALFFTLFGTLLL